MITSLWIVTLAQISVFLFIYEFSPIKDPASILTPSSIIALSSIITLGPMYTWLLIFAFWEILALLEVINFLLSNGLLLNKFRTLINARDGFSTTINILFIFFIETFLWTIITDALLFFKYFS